MDHAIPQAGQHVGMDRMHRPFEHIGLAKCGACGNHTFVRNNDTMLFCGHCDAYRPVTQAVAVWARTGLRGGLWAITAR